MATKPPDAFLSYTHFDDQYHGGAIGRLCDRLSMAVRAITAKPFEIFRDVDGIELGENWRERLNIALGEARFFIPILTPNYFESKACREELARFLDFEKQSRRNDLILPIYYIDCGVLEDPKLRSDDPLAMEIDGRQRYDWRKLRNKPFGNSAVRTELERLAHRLDRARLRTMPERRAAPTSGEAQVSVSRPEQTVAVPPRRVIVLTPHEADTAIKQLQDNVARVKELSGKLAGNRKVRDQAGPARPEALRPGTVFRDIDAPWCPEMVVIPPGEFMMGSPQEEEGRQDSEGPQHLVKIGYPLAVGRYPVTFEEYDHFARTPDRELPSDEGWGRCRRPVINVSWHDAKAYIEWIASKTGQPYRLLSEAEWEYVCRAGSAKRYWWGDGSPTPDQANFGWLHEETTEVDAYPANTWGLYDMTGNVWEWVEDCRNDSYEGAPSDGSAWTSGHCTDRVWRGGCWALGPEILRSAFRGSNATDVRVEIVGFRVARTLELSQPSAEQLQKILLNAKYRLFYNPAVPGLSKTKIMKFGPNGQILEGQNNNETTWRLRQGLLELLDSKGNVHIRFYYSADDKRFFHTNDPDTGSILKHGIRDQYMITEE